MNISPKKYHLQNIGNIRESILTTTEIFLTIAISPYRSSRPSLRYNGEQIRKELENISQDIKEKIF